MSKYEKAVKHLKEAAAILESIGAEDQHDFYADRHAADVHELIAQVEQGA